MRDAENARRPASISAISDTGGSLVPNAVTRSASGSPGYGPTTDIACLARAFLADQGHYGHTSDHIQISRTLLPSMALLDCVQTEKRWWFYLVLPDTCSTIWHGGSAAGSPEPTQG